LRIRIHLIRIRIQHFWLNTDRDPDPIRIQGFYDQKFKKFAAEKKFNFFYQTTIYLSLGFHKERPCYRRSLVVKREHSAIQKHDISNFFLLLWVIFALLDPDSDSSIDLIESGSNPDPIRIRICYLDCHALEESFTSTENTYNLKFLHISSVADPLLIHF
jgi:hypothetical protein